MAYYSAVIDTATHSLLALSPHKAIIEFLAQSETELEAAHGVNWPNYVQHFWLTTVPQDKYPEWTWDLRARRFSPISKALITEDLRRRSRLLIKKGRALWGLHVEIDGMRYPVWRGLLMQETVYMIKRMQAKEFKEAGYPKDAELQYPFVFQYADLVDLPPRVAADEILFKARLCDEVLAKTELVRLKYFNLIKEAKDTGTVAEISKDFYREIFSQN